MHILNHTMYKLVLCSCWFQRKLWPSCIWYTSPRGREIIKYSPAWGSRGRKGQKYLPERDQFHVTFIDLTKKTIENSKIGWFDVKLSTRESIIHPKLILSRVVDHLGKYYIPKINTFPGGTREGIKYIPGCYTTREKYEITFPGGLLKDYIRIVNQFVLLLSIH